MSFASDIEHEANGEEIEAIVIGPHGWSGFRDNERVPDEKQGKVLSWEEARPMLDYNYDAGFGSPDCHAITAFTANKVLFVGQYDGSTWVASVPRNPVEHTPDMPGGS